MTKRNRASSLPGNVADLVLLGGKVLTCAQTLASASAIAMRDGRIVAVGHIGDVREMIGSETRVVELAGRTVLPGINDSHLHGCALGSSLPPMKIDVGFPAVRSISDIQRTVSDEVDARPPGVPILGAGWDLGYLEECTSSRRVPTRWDLDEVAPRNPVLLQDFSGHTSWVNTAWMQLAGVRGSETVPPGGVIARDERGLLGLFSEGAQDLVQRACPELDDETIDGCIRATVSYLHRLGITSFTEPGLGPGGERLKAGAMSTRVLERYVNLVRAGELPVRVSALWLPCSMEGSAAVMAQNLDEARLSSGIDPRRLRLVGAKIYADGVPPNRTAWMNEEYPGGGHGSLCVHGGSDDERAIELREMIRLVHVAGLQAGVHVTGDAGIDAVTSAFEAAVQPEPRDARHYVIHGDFIGAQSLKRLAAGSFGLNMNPTIKWTISDLMDDVVGQERSARQWPVRTALASGVHVSSSSDAPAVRPDWLRGVSAMMLRESKATGNVSGPGETVSLEEAVRAYTVSPAWQDFAETWKGSIEPGKAADLCVLGGDLGRTDPHDIPGLPIDMTVFDGDVVYERAS